MTDDMATYRLVVSNPPQNGVDADEAARQLGLTPEQFRGKAAYSVPEVWFAHPDLERAADTARALLAAGCKVVVLSSDRLAEVPVRHRVRAFSFAEDGFVAHLDGSDIPVPYDYPVVAVFCRPREPAPDLAAAMARPRRSSGYLSYRDRILETAPATGMQDDTGTEAVPFLDLWLMHGAEPTRLTISQNAVSFAGLGRVQPRAASNMEALVGSCEDRFGQTRVDRRLVGMRLRFRGGGPRPAGSEHRRGFSFASPGLHALLAAVSPGFEAVSQPELSTRLAVLTRQPTA
ncbi:MAG: hypothetical protein OER21_04635 [Gemmatimonadota bacterium]|nr:hypothetical protein [Gemmatimonadota bacterium]